MKQLKEKSKAQIEIERLKEKPLSADLKEVIRKKEAYINRDIRK